MDLLLEDTEREAKRSHLGLAWPRYLEACTFKVTVEAGWLRWVVRQLTSQEGGGVRHPDNLCLKASQPVVDILREKYPEMRDLEAGMDSGAFEPHKKVPQPMPIQVPGPR